MATVTVTVEISPTLANVKTTDASFGGDVAFGALHRTLRDKLRRRGVLQPAARTALYMRNADEVVAPPADELLGDLAHHFFLAASSQAGGGGGGGPLRLTVVLDRCPIQYDESS